MRINSRIRGRLLVLAALIVVVSWPELAGATDRALPQLADQEVTGALWPGRPDL